MYDPVFKKHNAGYGHPECAERCDAVMHVLDEAIVEGVCHLHAPRKGTRDEVLLVHSPDYYEIAKDEIESGWPVLSTGDTNVCVDSYESAMYAVGALCDAVDHVMRVEGSRAFCVVRPPGHHATPDRGMGFCVFNNVAIAARYAQKQHNLRRILIADWDVHHGNGTQDAFYDDPSVFFFSTHQWPLFPGTGQRSQCGSGKGKGTTMNFPFSPGAGAGEVVKAFKEHLVPAMREFRPELVLVSAGFDSMLGDIIGNFELTDDDFAKLTMVICEIADEHCGGRVVSSLEGGYSLKGLGKAVAAHVGTLAKSTLQ